MQDGYSNEYLMNYDMKMPKVGEGEYYGIGDINHNGEMNFGEQLKCVDDDSDNDRSESKSEVTLCPSPNVSACRSAKSNETSTDTLVAENGIVTR